MKFISLVPGINERENVYMYCNYARMNPYEECEKNDCKHKGEHTFIEK